MCKPGSTSAAASPRKQINENTAFIDGSQIYGSDVETSGHLRALTGGLLKTNTKSGVGNLPTRSQCAFSSPPKMASDLIAGDIRVTEQPTLASIHTLFLNEHNAIVAGIEPFLKKSTAFLKMSSSEQDEFLYQVGAHMYSYLSVTTSEWKAPGRSRATADHLQVSTPASLVQGALQGLAACGAGCQGSGGPGTDHHPLSLCCRLFHYE